MVYHEGHEQKRTPDVVELYEGLVEPHRLYYPEGPEGVTEDIIRQVRGLKENGAHIAIVDGAYDVPHDSHAWYLRDCRRVAAERFHGFSTTVAVASGGRKSAQSAIASAEVFLIVTLDADEKVSRLKGDNVAKGGSKRPVYPWEARANRIGGYTIPDGHGAFRPVIDLIVPEGDSRHENTILESHLSFGGMLAREGLLDSWIFYGEHSTNSELAQSLLPDPGILAIIPKHLGYAKDPRTSQEWHSSEIIRLIRGE